MRQLPAGRAGSSKRRDVRLLAWQEGVGQRLGRAYRRRVEADGQRSRCQGALRERGPSRRSSSRLRSRPQR